MFLWCLVLGAWCLSAHAAFVYETPAEFITSGDFDGDGRADALVLDKLTGNVRVGYQNANGALVWSAPRATGAESSQRRWPWVALPKRTAIPSRSRRRT